MNTLTAPLLADTLLACCKSIGVCTEYIKGKEYAPHYPMPAIYTEVEYWPASTPIAVVLWGLDKSGVATECLEYWY